MKVVDIPDEIKRFMQPCSSMVTFAKSVQNNAPGGPSDQNGNLQQQQQLQEPENPFAKLDWDNLPEDVRTQLQAAQTQFTTLQTQNTEYARKVEGATNIARKFQSEKDQAVAVLQRHNLSLDGNQSNGEPPVNPLLGKLEKRLVADGLTPENSKVFAKMMAGALEEIRPDLLKEVGTAIAPHLQNVGVMSVERLLTIGVNNPDLKPALSIPEVANKTREYLVNMVNLGMEVNDTTLESTAMMAYGQHLAKNPAALQQQNAQVQQVVGGGRNPFAPGFSPSVANLQVSDAPMAANAETANAANQAMLAMRRGMKSKK